MEPAFNSDMLTIARQARGLSQSELARRLNGAIVQARLSRIENGLAVPGDSEIDLLARTLGFRRRFFFHPVRRRASPPAYHRKRQRLRTGEWDKIYARAEIYRVLLAVMLRSVELAPKRELPPPRDPHDVHGRVEEIAGGVRQFWMIPRGPVADVTRLVEGAGVVVIVFDFGTEFCDGFSQHGSEDLPPIIFVNTRQPKDKLRFTLAHELGHLVMHRMPTPNMEAEADRFAAEFLMPTEDIEDSLYRLSMEQFMALKMRWKVSIQSLIRKARDLGKLNERMYRYYHYELSRHNQRKIEPIEIGQDIERPRIFQQLLSAHTDSLSYSLDDLSEVFGISERELEASFLPIRPRLRLVAS